MPHARKSSWLSGFAKSSSKDKTSSSTSKEKASSSNHSRNKSAPDPASLVPSTPSEAPPAISTSSRRSSTTSSYFSPQSVATGQDPRSPGTRKPPASHSGNGMNNTLGPPVALLTRNSARGNSDIARRSAQKPADFAFAQQQFVQAGLVSPTREHSLSRSHRGNTVKATDPPPKQTKPRPVAQRTPTATTSQSKMASSVDDSSDDSGPRSQSGDIYTTESGNGATSSSSTDEEQAEDVFINIAADSALKQHSTDKAARTDRLKSRIARVNNRQPSPSRVKSPVPAPIQRSYTTPTTTRTTSALETKSSSQRRPALLPASSLTGPERQSTMPTLNPPRIRAADLSHKRSFSRKDAELSPREFLAQFQRRSSQQDTTLTPPQRTPSYRPSNLNPSALPDPRSPPMESVYETTSRHDETESHASTGPAASVWDELDELKSRIRKIELGGKIPSTSGAAVSQASADRPRTANTSATTVSSSPNQHRKGNTAPSEADTQFSGVSKVQPLLQDALAGARQHISPAIYRILEATASEALTLADMTGGSGPQGMLNSTASISAGSDRQIRRKADNICRSLTELCIAMSDSRPSLASPAHRSSAAMVSRRPSIHMNGDSPIRQSIEPESDTMRAISPSRALSRIEARRTSLLTVGNGRQQDSQEPFEDRQVPSRLSRMGMSTGLQRARGGYNDEEEDPTVRVPSRAMTDFRSIRNGDQRYTTSRQYTSREPMPEAQPTSTLRSTANHLRRPTMPSIASESLLFRDQPRRYEINRESSPALEKQPSTVRARAHLSAARNPNVRNSIGGISELNRTVSLGGRRVRGQSIGE